MGILLQMVLMTLMTAVLLECRSESVIILCLIENKSRQNRDNEQKKNKGKAQQIPGKVELEKIYVYIKMEDIVWLHVYEMEKVKKRLV